MMASQMADAYDTNKRINPNAIWSGGFLPSATEHNIFAVAKKKARTAPDQGTSIDSWNITAAVPSVLSCSE